MLFKNQKILFTFLSTTLVFYFVGCKQNKIVSETDPLTLMQDGSEHDSKVLYYKKEILKKVRKGIFEFPFDSAAYFMDYNYLRNENPEKNLYDLFFIIYELPMQGKITVSKMNSILLPI